MRKRNGYRTNAYNNKLFFVTIVSQKIRHEILKQKSLHDAVIPTRTNDNNPTTIKYTYWYGAATVNSFMPNGFIADDFDQTKKENPTIFQHVSKRF